MSQKEFLKKSKRNCDDAQGKLFQNILIDFTCHVIKI
jgi:hypothetical protein